MQSTVLSREERDEKRRLKAERDAAIRLKNNKLGITIFQISWIMVFICLIVVYWQMGYNPNWRPAPEQKPSLILPTIATLALLGSTWTARAALQAIKADSVARFQRLWRWTIGLGAAFFVIMMQQLFSLPPDSDITRYVQVFRVMIVYHAVHALAIGYMMVQVYRYSQWGNYHAGNNWSIEATVRLWYFVTVAWVMFYVALYII